MQRSPVVRIIFVSEGNVCRSVYAEAIFRGLLQEQGLMDVFSCSSKVCSRAATTARVASVLMLFKLLICVVSVSVSLTHF